ncbi:MAG: restriction endonuclease subunit S [Thermoleophilia bacterium]
MSLTIAPARIVEESDSPLLVAPAGWPRQPLGEVAEILNGFAFKSRQFVAGGGVPLIRIRDIFKSETAIGYVGDYDERYVVRRGELLVGMDGDFNCARWAGPDALLNQRVCKITPDPDVLDLDYLTVVLPGYLQAIHDLTSSTTVTHLSSRDVVQIPLPVPSLTAQRAFAAAAGSAASSASRASSHLTSARRAIERFRQAVFAAACSGRLTADWRSENTVGMSADDLVAGIEEARRLRLGHRFRVPARPVADTELPDRWTWTTVGTLVDVATGATPLRKRSDYYGGSIPWVTSGAVNAGLIVSATEYITDLAVSETNAKVFPVGTLLVAMYGEGQTRGRVAELGISAATNQAVAALLFDEATETLRDYLRVFFMENYERIRLLSFGGVQPNLSLGVIRDTLLPLPPLDEQVEIVGRVDRVLSLAEGLRSRIESAAKRVDRSSRAVLAKGLRGELACGQEKQFERSTYFDDPELGRVFLINDDDSSEERRAKEELLSEKIDEVTKGHNEG